MKKFSFDHLTDVQFEEYCFDLIKALGFTNVDWRKGTGKSTSPADSGRDIEAEKIHRDFDGETTMEKWFFDCKKHKRGVSADKLQGSLSWATAERPDKLVFMCSNFLSNPCKDYLEKYEKGNRPTFKIKVWELPTLEEFTFGKNQILFKFKLSDGPPDDSRNIAELQDELNEKFRDVRNAQSTDVKEIVYPEFRHKLATLYNHPPPWNSNIRRIVSQIFDFIEGLLPNASITDTETYVEWIDLLLKDKKTFELARKKFLDTVKKFYLSADFEYNLRVFNLLQQFHEYKKSFMKKLVDEAIDKWSDEKFSKLNGHIRFERLQNNDQDAFRRIRQHLLQRIEEASKSNNAVTKERARKLYERVKGQ